MVFRLVRLVTTLVASFLEFLGFTYGLVDSLNPIDHPWDAIVGLCLSLKATIADSWDLRRVEILKQTKAILSLIPGQMTYLVASLTLDSARSYVMQGAHFTQGTISSIPIGGNKSPEGFLPSILLMVIMVTVVNVVVILVIVVVATFRVGVVVAIVGVVIVVIIIRIVVVNSLGKSPVESFHKFFGVCSRTILIGQEPFISVQVILSACSIPIGVSLGPVVLSVFVMLAAYAFRAAKTLSATSFLMAA
nr:hypothetical protein [Tanacetum cinerariifolium]